MSEKRNAGLAVPTALLVALAVPVAATLPGCGGEATPGNTRQAATPDPDAKPGDDVPYGDDWEYEGKGLTMLAMHGGEYRWDIDGDGSEDALAFEFVDQGDEAMSGYEVTLVGDDSEKKIGWLEGACDIASAQGGVDAEGPFLVIRYDIGDADHVAGTGRSLMRLDGDWLSVTELERVID